MDFVFGFPEYDHKNNDILVFVGRFNKMMHLAVVTESITAQGCARVFIYTIIRLHGLPRELVSGRDRRFTAKVWQSVFRSLEARLNMSSDPPPPKQMVRRNVLTVSSKK